MEGKIAICIFALAGLSLAASYIGAADSMCTASLFEGPFAPRNMTWIAMAFMLTVALIALAYMFAKATENENMLVWAHDEMFNLGISALVVAGVIALIVGSCTVLSSYTSQEEVAGAYASANPFTTDYKYLDALANTGLKGVEAHTKKSLKQQLDATAYLYIGLPSFDSTGVALKASKKALAAHQEMVIDMLMPLVVSLKAQRGALQMIELAVMGAMMPFAIILRIIPFTRNAGNFMLAAVFGLFVVVPGVYALSAGAWKGIGQPQDSPLVGDALDFRDRALGEACGVWDCPLYQIGALIPQAIFLPNLVLVVLATCVMALSRALQALVI